MLASQLGELVASGGLKAGAIVRLPASGYSGNMVNGAFTLMISELEVEQQGKDGPEPMEVRLLCSSERTWASTITPLFSTTISI